MRVEEVGRETRRERGRTVRRLPTRDGCVCVCIRKGWIASCLHLMKCRYRVHRTRVKALTVPFMLLSRPHHAVSGTSSSLGRRSALLSHAASAERGLDGQIGIGGLTAELGDECKVWRDEKKRSGGRVPLPRRAERPKL